MSRPPRILSSVDLPDPDGPSRTTNSREDTSKSTPRSANTSISPIWYTFVMPRAVKTTSRSRTSPDDLLLTLSAIAVPTHPPYCRMSHAMCHVELADAANRGRNKCRNSDSPLGPGEAPTTESLGTPPAPPSLQLGAIGGGVDIWMS